VNQNWLVTAFFFTLLSVILYGAFLILTPFLTAITWAVILAILVYPLYAWLLRILRGRSTLAAFTVTAIVTLIVLAPGIELVRFLTEEAMGAATGELVETGIVSLGGLQYQLEGIVGPGGTELLQVLGRAGHRDCPECFVVYGKFPDRLNYFVFSAARR
jgi:hypothetical protein